MRIHVGVDAQVVGAVAQSQEAVESVLEENEALATLATTLDLGLTHISDHGVNAIASALETGKTKLTNLDLSRNTIAPLLKKRPIENVRHPDLARKNSAKLGQQTCTKK